MRPIEWLAAGRVRFLDQTRLPGEELWVETADYRDLAHAIREMGVRGAPLIGITAAYAMALAAREAAGSGPDALLSRLRDASDELMATRPTAVNLRWALDLMLAVAERAPDAQAAVAALEAEALRIHEGDVAGNRRIGAYGASLLDPGARLLTHCNTGSLATGGYGTALGVVRAVHAEGKLGALHITETRPLNQGARLTAWELRRDGIPFTLVVDSAAGSLLHRGLVTAVVVGADRIAANGDVANKIGTYPLAVLARENGAPFYVAAPTTTLDLDTASGDDIPIEERAAAEVAGPAEGLSIANPAFDVTPAEYVTAIITENGIARPPYGRSLGGLVKQKAASRG
ncbi:MAG: S-methyl-5-thioribose-1-phosphate isomerase [Dehalococcoidia bacterium]